MGQPMEHALRTCVLSTNAARQLGVTGPDLSDVYYLSLLRFIGCTSDAREAAISVGGDDIAFRAAVATVLMGETPEFLGFMLRNFAADQGPLARTRMVAKGIATGKRDAAHSIELHCEIAQMLVARLGLNAEIGVSVGQTFERWDGKGIPGKLAGEAIPIRARVVAVARDFDVFYRLGGEELARSMLTKRRGKAYEPAIADVFLELGGAWLSQLDEGPSAWEAAVATEPGPPLMVEEAALDGVLEAFASFVDLKSPCLSGHSAQVSSLAAAAAASAGLDATEVSAVRRAGLVHDIGRVSIPAGIMEKPGPLTATEWERVRLHPYFTERALSYAPIFQHIAPLASAHHERSNGSGYHRGAGAPVSRAAAILAAADAYQSKCQPRPYRPALDASDREALLLAEAAAGRLESQAVRCVLSVAGHTQPRQRQEGPAALTEREIDVLRLISRGQSNREVAEALTISPKTVGRHIENIYGKAGVSSRAAAALFAMQHHLLD